MKLEKEMKDILIESLNLDKTKDLECVGIRKFGPKMFFILLKNGKQYIACIPIKSNQIRLYNLNYKAFDIEGELVVMKIQGFNFNWYCSD